MATGSQNEGPSIGVRPIPPPAAPRHWLTPTRLESYTTLTAVAVLFTYLFFVGRSVPKILAGHTPYIDLVVFWVVAKNTLSGHAQDMYDLLKLHHQMLLVCPDEKGWEAWSYPPLFYLIITPLGWLPYVWAYTLFMVSTMGGIVRALWMVFPGKWMLRVLLSSPAVWFNLFLGQNGFLTAFLAGAGLLALHRQRPILAGLLIGLLTVKPQLGILFPLALLACRAWKTLLTATVTAIFGTWLTTQMWGVGVLSNFLRSVPVTRSFILENQGIWGNMPTVFAFLSQLGISLPVAYGVQAVVALGTGIVVWNIWRSSTPADLRYAALMSGSLLVSPYVFDYDQVWLAFPIAWLTKRGLDHGWNRWEREVLVFAWACPILLLLTSKVLHLQIGPLASIGLLWIIWQRHNDGSLAGEQELTTLA